MNTTFKKLIDSMNQHYWLRLVICLSPGLVLAKLFGVIDGSPRLNIVSSLVLGVGMAIYFFWEKILTHLDPSESAEPDIVQLPGETLPADDVMQKSGAQCFGLLKDLRTACQGDWEAAMRLIETEINLNSKLSFEEAVDVALRRYQYSKAG